MTPFKQNKPHEKRTRPEGRQAGHLQLRGKGEAIAKQKAQRSGGRPCTTRLSKHWTRRGRQPVAVLESAQQRECPVRALPFIGMDLRPDAMPPQSSHHSCHGPNSTPGLPGHVPTPVAKNKGAKTPLPQPMPPPHLRRPWLWRATGHSHRSKRGSARAPDAAAPRRRCREPTEASVTLRPCRPEASNQHAANTTPLSQRCTPPKATTQICGCVSGAMRVGNVVRDQTGRVLQ